MAKLQWDKIGERLFEAGVDRGVLYRSGKVGVPWNGLVSISENPSGGTVNPYYIDGVKYYNEATGHEYHATLEAFTYPDDFAYVNGSVADGGLIFEEQDRENFGLTYRTMVGNDLEGTDYGYKIHMIYNAIASPTKSPNTTLTRSVDPNNFSWDITATPEFVEGRKPTAHFIFDSTKSPAYKVEELESILYGSSGKNPRLPTTEELLGLNSWGEALHIEPRTSGVADLLYVGSGDLKGNVTRGIYTKHADSRLVAAATPGFFKLGA